MFDQQPVGSLATRPIVLHSHEHPTAVQSLALQRELQVAFGQGLLRRRVALGLPIAAIPELDGPAAILALRDRALEIAIIQRVILDFDRQPLVVRIERWASRHRPGLEHAVEFEAQIIMKARRVMFLDDETAPLARRRIGSRRSVRRSWKNPASPGRSTTSFSRPCLFAFRPARMRRRANPAASSEPETPFQVPLFSANYTPVFK